MSERSSAQNLSEPAEPDALPSIAPSSRTNSPFPVIPSTPNTLPHTPSKQPLPDVLVDPFKDDPSAANSSVGEGDVQLTSGRRHTLSNPYRDSSSGAKPVRAGEAAPTPMTKAQRAVHESGSMVPNRYKNSAIDRAVVPTAYFEAAPPVKSKSAKTFIPNADEIQPSVGRIPVPGR